MPKSILQVDVDDAKFREFQELFDAYRDKVRDLPGDWNKVGAAAEGAHGRAGRAGGATAAAVGGAVGVSAEEVERSKKIAETMEKAATAMERVAKALETVERVSATAARNQDSFSRAIDATNRGVHRLGRETATVAKHIGDATVSLLKWEGLLSIAGGLLGAGALFGIDRLASGAGAARRQAQGLGVSIAEEGATRFNYQRYFDTDPALANVAEGKWGYGKEHVALRQAGLSEAEIRAKDPAQLLQEYTERTRAMFLGSDRSSQFAQAHGFLNIFGGMEDLRRLGAASDTDMQQSRQSYTADLQRLKLSGQEARSLQNLDIQLRRAGATIETDFQRRLVQLAPSLGHLSDAFTRAVEAFLNNQNIKKWLDELAVGLNKLADYLSGPTVEKDIDWFLTKVNDAAKGVVSFAEAVENMVEWWTGKSDKDTAGPRDLPAIDANGNPVVGTQWEWRHGLPTAVSVLPSHVFPATSTISPAGRAQAAAIIKEYTDAGLSHAFGVGAAGNMLIESGGNPTAEGRDAQGNLTNHYGLFQLGQAQQAAFKKMFGMDIRDPRVTPYMQRLYVLRTIELDAEMMKRAHSDNVTFSSNVFNHGFERPGNYALEDPLRAAKSAQVENVYQSGGLGVPGLAPPPANDSVDSVLARLRREQRARVTAQLPPILIADHHHDDAPTRHSDARVLAAELAKHRKHMPPVHPIRVTIHNRTGADVYAAGAQVAAQ